MKRALLSAALAATLLAAPGVSARGTHHSSVSHHSSSSHHSASHSHTSRAYPGVRRDVHGRIVRSGEAKDQFRKSHHCPATGKRYGACPGYVIDHIQALKHGGADAPYNMQWQTNAAAKAKDKWE